MSPFANSTITTNYCYWLPIKVDVIGTNPVSLSFDECKVDTGFNRDFCISGSFEKDLEDIGVNFFDETYWLADGEKVDGRVCYAKISKVSNYTFSTPIDIELTCLGSGTPKIGLRLLNKWIAIFHGRHGQLRLYKW